MLCRHYLTFFSILLGSCFMEAKKLPEVSSTLLKVHRMYTSHPPHDSTLYEILRVSPNATSADIQKSYRKLARQYHPDKLRQRQKSSNDNNNDSVKAAQEQFDKIRQAHDILHKDSTRLLYHRYGLYDVSTAILILTGYHNTPKIPPPGHQELLHLMGYHPDYNLQQQPQYYDYGQDNNNPQLMYSDNDNEQRAADSYAELRDQRVSYLAATTVERIRPLVEGTLSEAIMADAIMAECDRLKKLPLGAHILRCVGRAYRHAGQRYLRQLQRQREQQQQFGKLTIRDRWHDTKHILTAAVASGRMALNENWLHKATTKAINSKKKNTNNNKPAIGYHHFEGSMGLGMLEDEEEEDCNGDKSGDDMDDDWDALTDEELQQQEALKAKKIMVELAQVEALWKVHKIGIDRAIREACAWIMSGRYFFFPSHQYYTTSSSSQGHPYYEQAPSVHGWVSASSTTSRSREQTMQHTAVDAQEARWRAASALVLIGNVMVQSSKEGTAWVE